jgi:hypothetical protein
MRTSMAKKSIWWQEPMVWLIILLPMAAVVGAFISAWFAFHGADSMVADEDYHKEGFAIHQDLERYYEASKLDVHARLAAGNGFLTVHLKGHMDRFPDLLNLIAIHPSRAAEDATIKLTAIGTGVYTASLPAMIASKRRLILEPPNRSWRLAGNWEAPFKGDLTLTPRSQLPATHP